MPPHLLHSRRTLVTADARIPDARIPDARPPVQAPAAAAPVRLVVWGMETSAESKDMDAKIRVFEERHPDIKIAALSMGAGAMNPQKLMTAIVGGVPPDLVQQDRFTIGDWASRDAFRPLDDHAPGRTPNSSDPLAIRRKRLRPGDLGGDAFTRAARLRHPEQHRRPRPLLQPDPVPAGRPGPGPAPADLGGADRGREKASDQARPDRRL